MIGPKTNMLCRATKILSAALSKLLGKITIENLPRF